MPAARPHPFQALTARDIMNTEVLTVSRSAPLSELERLLAEHRIGGMPVTDEAGHVVGVVSMRDLLERYAQEPTARPRSTPGYYELGTEEFDEDELDAFQVPEEAEDTVADIMTGDVYSVVVDTVLPEVAAKMVEMRIHRILVREGQQFAGLITTFDLLRALAR